MFGTKLNIGGLRKIVDIAITRISTSIFKICHYFSGNKDAAGECLAIIRGRSRAGVQAELDLAAADVAASQEKTATVLLISILPQNLLLEYFLRLRHAVRQLQDLKIKTRSFDSGRI